MEIDIEKVYNSAQKIRTLTGCALDNALCKRKELSRSECLECMYDKLKEINREATKIFDETHAEYYEKRRIRENRQKYDLKPINQNRRKNNEGKQHRHYAGWIRF